MTFLIGGAPLDLSNQKVNYCPLLRKMSGKPHFRRSLLSHSTAENIYKKIPSICFPCSWHISFWPFSFPVPGIPRHIQAAGDRAAAAAGESLSHGHCRDFGLGARRGVARLFAAAAEEQLSFAELMAKPGRGAGQRAPDQATAEGNHHARGQSSSFWTKDLS